MTLIAQKRACWERNELSSRCEVLASCKLRLHGSMGSLESGRQTTKQALSGRASSVQAMPHLNTSDCSKTSLVRKLATSPEMEEGSSSNSLSSCHSAEMQKANSKRADTAKGPRVAEHF